MPKIRQSFLSSIKLPNREATQLAKNLAINYPENFIQSSENRFKFKTYDGLRTNESYLITKTDIIARNLQNVNDFSKSTFFDTNKKSFITSAPRNFAFEQRMIPYKDIKVNYDKNTVRNYKTYMTENIPKLLKKYSVI